MSDALLADGRTIDDHLKSAIIRLSPWLICAHKEDLHDTLKENISLDSGLNVSMASIPYACALAVRVLRSLLQISAGKATAGPELDSLFVSQPEFIKAICTAMMTMIAKPGSRSLKLSNTQTSNVYRAEDCWERYIAAFPAAEQILHDSDALLELRIDDPTWLEIASQTSGLPSFCTEYIPANA